MFSPHGKYLIHNVSRESETERESKCVLSNWCKRFFVMGYFILSMVAKIQPFTILNGLCWKYWACHIHVYFHKLYAIVRPFEQWSKHDRGNLFLFFRLFQIHFYYTNWYVSDNCQPRYNMQRVNMPNSRVYRPFEKLAQTKKLQARKLKRTHT